MSAQWKEIEAELRANVHTRNLEDIGCVVTFYEPESYFDGIAFAQVNYGKYVAYQGLADERYTAFSWGFTQAAWMTKGTA